MAARSPVVAGFRASGVRCGIKQRGPALAVVGSDGPATGAGLFTRSSVVGAPVELSRERVRVGRARAVVVNSGISNVAMGRRGLADAKRMTEWTARALGCDAREVLVASTGVIGKPLPLAKLARGIPAAVRALAPDGLPRAARAILTTDTRPKLAWRRIRLRARSVGLARLAKGAGMIQPDLATMLAFLVTDAAIAPPLLRRLLRDAAEESFNRLSIDGETSTSDTLLLFANGRAGNPELRGPRSPGLGRFAAALADLCQELARELARDGEGATRPVTARGQEARGAAHRELAAGQDGGVRRRSQLGPHPPDRGRGAGAREPAAHRGVAGGRPGLPRRRAHRPRSARASGRTHARRARGGDRGAPRRRAGGRAP